MSCRNSALDFSAVPKKDKSFKSSTWVEIDSPLALPKPIDGLILRFPIPASKLFLDGLQTFLRCSFRVKTWDGKDLPNTPVKVAIEPGLGGCLIGRLELWNQGKPVRVYSNYPYLYHSVHLLNHSKGYFDSLGTASHFELDQVTVTGEGRWVANPGLEKRRELVQRSAVFETVSRLFLPVFLQEKLLPTENQDLAIVLHLASSPFLLTRSNDTPGKKDYVLHLESAKLLTNMIELSPDNQNQVDNILRKNQIMKYPFRDYDLVSFFLQQGLMQKVTPQGNFPIHPSRVIVFFVSSEAMNGTQTLSSYHYKNYQINQLQLRLGEKVFSMSDMDFSEEHKKSVWSYFKSVYSGLAAVDRNFPFDVNAFKDIYSIFAMDVTPTQFGADCPELSVSDEQGVAYSISVKFGVPLPENCHMFILTESDKIAELTTNFGLQGL